MSSIFLRLTPSANSSFYGNLDINSALSSKLLEYFGCSRFGKNLLDELTSRPTDGMDISLLILGIYDPLRRQKVKYSLKFDLYREKISYEKKENQDQL